MRVCCRVPGIVLASWWLQGIGFHGHLAELLRVMASAS